VTHRQSWEIYDTRDGREVQMSVYPTREQAVRAVEYYIWRDANGGRPDVSDTIPHLAVRPVVRAS
jgi:hypothetical protein